MSGGTKHQSPHPALQAMLPRLAELTAEDEFRPILQSREEAEELVEAFNRTEADEHYLRPVWAIDHKDLAESSIVGWTFVGQID